MTAPRSRATTERMRALRVLGVIAGGLALYFGTWPVPVAPVAWEAPTDDGYVGDFAPNTELANLERLPLGDFTGAEDLAIATDGELYASTHEGKILRMGADGGFTVFADTAGRPLGIEFDGQGNLLVADAYRGLLSVTSSGTVEVLARELDGAPIVYADDVAVTKDGDTIYFSDASTKFGAEDWGGTFAASKLDILEHGGHGRILVHTRSATTTEVLVDGLQFANGVALSEDETHLVIAETGSYRVLVHHLAGPKKGRTEPLVENLPGFPDNVERAPDGRFWVGLVSGRSKPVDATSGMPRVRKLMQRLPAFLRPDAVHYGHVFSVGLDGSVQHVLQDPTGAYAKTTGARVLGDHLYITSLDEPDLARRPWPR